MDGWMDVAVFTYFHHTSLPDLPPNLLKFNLSAPKC
uniref:Uncharacterized protein n=1 Tax=Setaria italica TaxID=4555 RepID=K4A3V1_SETIT